MPQFSALTGQQVKNKATGEVSSVTGGTGISIIIKNTIF